MFVVLSLIGWSEELLIDAWNSDREAACEKAGIKPQDGQNDITSYSPVSEHEAVPELEVYTMGVNFRGWFIFADFEPKQVPSHEAKILIP